MVELNNMPGISTFFPDGTWCHNDGAQNYYCQNHECLPQSSRAGKSLTVDTPNDDPLSHVSNNQDDTDKNVKIYLQFVPDDNGQLVPRIDDLPPDSIASPPDDGHYVDDVLDDR